MHPRFNRILRAALLASGWGMAPFCLGLVAALLLVTVQFFRDLGLVVVSFGRMDGSDVMLAVLKLVDLVFIANLVVMIIDAVVELFLPRAAGDGEAAPGRRVAVDFFALKLRVFASLSAIAAIHLLERVLNIDAADKGGVLWEIAILLAFVASGVLLAAMDRLGADRH